MKLEKIRLTDITEAEYNPRKISDSDKQKLRNSISTFGVVDPIIINLQNNKIIGGHQRYNALLDEYMEDNSFFEELNLLRLGDIGWVFPSTDLKIESEEHEKALNLALNKISGEWDTPKLESLLDELNLSELDVTLTGFDNIELEELSLETYTPQDAVEDEYFEAPHTETNIQKGDIYQLGEHKIMCGDSTNSEDVQKLLGEEKAKILFTSPPYSDQRTYNTTKEALEVNNLIQFISTYKPYTNYQVINLGLQQKEKEVVRYWDAYLDYAKEQGYKLLSWNVWDRQFSGSIGQQKQMFGLQHEWIFVFGTEPFELIKTVPKKEESISARGRTKRRQVDGTLRLTSQGDMSNPCKKLGTVQTIQMEFGSIRHKHPATFPVELPFTYIEAMTNESDIVIDCFGGSGTTLIACEQLNRKARLMELSEEYCQVIIDRWEEFTGEKAEKIN